MIQLYTLRYRYSERFRYRDSDRDDTDRYEPGSCSAAITLIQRYKFRLLGYRYSERFRYRDSDRDTIQIDTNRVALVLVLLLPSYSDAI